mmetsp:Transcript_23381/g.73659  ORF Transcript_23381/g.73659 Transcript_23381/m.73659 type:complete len:263 (+) Transcript_23381:775-1563(+)
MRPSIWYCGGPCGTNLMSSKFQKTAALSSGLEPMSARSRSRASRTSGSSAPVRVPTEPVRASALRSASARVSLSPTPPRLQLPSCRAARGAKTLRFIHSWKTRRSSSSPGAGGCSASVPATQRCGPCHGIHCSGGLMMLRSRFMSSRSRLTQFGMRNGTLKLEPPGKYRASLSPPTTMAVTPSLCAACIMGRNPLSLESTTMILSGPPCSLFSRKVRIRSRSTTSAASFILGQALWTVAPICRAIESQLRSPLRYSNCGVVS